MFCYSRHTKINGFCFCFTFQDQGKLHQGVFLNSYLTMKEAIHLSIKGITHNRPSQFIMTDSLRVLKLCFQPCTRTMGRCIKQPPIHPPSEDPLACKKPKACTPLLIARGYACLAYFAQDAIVTECSWEMCRDSWWRGQWCVSRTELLSLDSNTTAHVGL